MKYGERSGRSVGADDLGGPRAATRGRPYGLNKPLLIIGTVSLIRLVTLGTFPYPLCRCATSSLPLLAFGHFPLIGGIGPLTRGDVPRGRHGRVTDLPLRQI